ncbi:MAG: hypothetical protein J6A61_00430 [Clostridia bacterium]|nr:hypothetical protein [Clostridia bacterium]
MYPFPYNDILNLRYPNREIETAFPDKILREAQFAPFAALTGYEEAVSETARVTEQKMIPDESQLEALNRKLQFLKQHLSHTPMVRVTHFVKDPKKEGGTYRIQILPIKKISETEKALLFLDGSKIYLHNISDLQSDIFPESE